MERKKKRERRGEQEEEMKKRRGRREEEEEERKKRRGRRGEKEERMKRREKEERKKRRPSRLFLTLTFPLRLRLGCRDLLLGSSRRPFLSSSMGKNKWLSLGYNSLL